MVAVLLIPVNESWHARGKRGLAPIQGVSHGAAFSSEMNSCCGICGLYPSCPFFNERLQNFVLKLNTYYKNIDSPISSCKMSRMLGMKGIFPTA